MHHEVSKVIKEKVNPILEQHFGSASITGIEDGVVKVKFLGACSSCPSAQQTLEDIVKNILMEEVPEVKDVVLDTSVSEELIEMAKKILNKEK
ncbi:MAG: NifU family protein [Clostridia bacterium]|nr:NifU family protein [Clostridia bacterium]